ncbi:Multidrug resistance protein B [Neochlamydia sp. TUME1]|uniref:DHA2 family efflux MFS transporter permease subunit n=1 Tax=Neochlamydia sp. TUME1 TaxID=1478174 RepID=UPI00057F5125|nr:DHA2 family efflux MFS transporter permease subunit [Neochlamydia sp. TUME1]KIC76033.1 Multidrug resistance protein B [Neochlamydia sp. TUME1]
MKNEQYEQGYRLTLLNVALGLGTFIQVLDTSIANVAIPYIAGNLNVSTEEGTWVITSFSASNAIILPLTGWLSDYFGRVRLFCWSIALFTITSFFCGFSSSLSMLVFFRVLQGAVAGSLIPLSQTLLLANHPPEKQGNALGFWGMIVIVAPILGPILGGYLTDFYSWPWIFYMNVPIGLFSASVTWYLLKDKDSQVVRNPIDWVGIALLSLGVGCLQIMLDKGKDLDWFKSNTILALAIASIITLSYFIIWTYYQPYPVVDLSFFRNINFAFGCLATTIGFLFYFGSTVTLPLWLQTEQGYTPFWAGLAVAPVGIIPFLLSTSVGKYMNRFDLRFISSLSFLFFALSFFYQAHFTTAISLQAIMLARFLQGLGVAIFFLPLVQLSLGNIPKNRYASASGLYNFIRILVGSGFGTSLSIELWTRLKTFHRARLTETLTIFNSSTEKFYETLENYHPFFTSDVSNQLLEKLIEQQGYMLSTNDLAWLAAWGFLAMIPLIFLCKKVKMSNSKSSTTAAH